MTSVSRTSILGKARTVSFKAKSGYILWICPLSPEEELVKAERGDISELMTTSFSETRTTEELVPAESEEEKDDEEEEEKAFQNRPYPPRIGVYLIAYFIFYFFTIIVKKKSVGQSKS